MKLLASLLCLFAVSAVSQDESTELPMQISLYGQITSDEGEPAATAQLEIYVDNGERNAEIPDSFRRFRIVTDSEGRYELQLLLFDGWRNVTFNVLSHGLNPIRYKVPYTAEMNGYLASLISSGQQRSRYSYQLQSREGWQQQERLIARYGDDSDKGRLLRRQGIPDRIKPFENNDGTSGELWFYYQAGFVVRFIGESRDQEFLFKPTTPPGQR